MANKDRQKRSARKARAAERRELEEKQAASAPADAKKADTKKVVAKKDDAKKAPAKKKSGFLSGVRSWFGDVRSEMRRVTWPSKDELKNYSVAVIGMLIVFGVAVWLVDTGVVAALVAYSGLRG